ncbi:putative phosphonopyruvate decarboxylase [Xylariomycetidae sp. FL2044]|nr:putative phosphonopyruvate decarboxylase [Xylariomycetidae sp. FL2044]
MAAIDPRLFYERALSGNGITHAFGVPDSCFKGLLSYLYATKHTPEHIVTASEGAAVALAAGYYLSTQKLAVAYMQNSGLANALNPLQSLAAKEVFGIPMLLMIGWRGRPGEHDEPEHLLAGPTTLKTLEINGFPYAVMPDTLEETTEAIARLINTARECNTPVALVVPNHRFADYCAEEPEQDGTSETPSGIWNGIATKKCNRPSRAEEWRSAGAELPLSREDAIRCVLKQLSKNDTTVSSVGGNSREIYMIRKENGEDLSRSFLSIGAMGHTYPLAYGVQIGHPLGRVFCIEGDGSFLMHVSNTAVLAAEAPPNLIHVMIHNGIHCSTGGQKMPMNTETLLCLAGSLPYKKKVFVDTAEGLVQACQWAEGGTLIVVVVNQSVRKILPRPSEHPHELRDSYMSSFTRMN